MLSCVFIWEDAYKEETQYASVVFRCVREGRRWVSCLPSKAGKCCNITSDATSVGVVVWRS